ncbi:hypothetical protein ASC97_20795 [Rhizobium sp. Root1203]|uniref:OB-fold-containig protein n=1 Tax=Rhizobium sp. Root1203 TaxID=1736427 RepID=UPI00070B40DA|nr:OB-fold-containig protein [Rhizobium sp. Root1203]KQV30641.1 hypothetical protein ASC97_20795 [Rhizobium sp. Root1203]
MHLLLAPECAPFAIAAVMLAGLTAIEILATTIGFSVSEWLGKPHADGHEGIAGMLSWLNVGGIPILILLMLVLGFFSIGGFVVQAIADAIWSPLPSILASIPAVVATVPLVRGFSRAIARFVPRDETYAVDAAEFVGRIGEVVTGPLDQGLPGRVRAKDVHGNWHTLRARAAKSESPIAIGARALLVDRKADVFIAVIAPDDLVEGQHFNKDQS